MGLWARFKAWLRRGRKSAAPVRRAAPDAQAGPDGARKGTPARVPTTSDPAAFVKLAERYLGMQMADTALHVCQRGLEAHPDHVAGRALLARIYVAKGMRADAQQLIDALVAELGDAPEVATLKGLMTSGPPAGARGAESPAGVPAGDSTRRELQALEGYLGRIRRELSRLGPV